MKIRDFPIKSTRTDAGGRQLSRRIRVTDVMTERTLWDSGEVESENQILIPYEGESLSPLTKYEYQIDTKTDSEEAVSGRGTFVTGKLGENGAANGSPPISREQGRNFSARSI